MLITTCRKLIADLPFLKKLLLFVIGFCNSIYLQAISDETYSKTNCKSLNQYLEGAKYILSCVYMHLTLYSCFFIRHAIHHTFLPLLLTINSCKKSGKKRGVGNHRPVKPQWNRFIITGTINNRFLTTLFFSKLVLTTTYTSTEPLLIPLVKEVGSVSKNLYKWS